MKRLKKVYFSLVELMVVIVIIGMLSGVVAIGVLKNIEDAKVGKSQADLKAINDSIVMYKAHTGRFPTDLKDLEVKPDGVKGWKGPYTQDGISDDAWNTPYVYVVNSGDKTNPYSVYSAGSDLQPGTEDDVYVSERAAEKAGASTTNSGSGGEGLDSIGPN